MNSVDCWTVIAALAEPGRSVIMRWYGLRGKTWTLEQIAEGLKLSRQRVHQIRRSTAERLAPEMREWLEECRKECLAQVGI